MCILSLNFIIYAFYVSSKEDKSKEKKSNKNSKFAVEILNPSNNLHDNSCHFFLLIANIFVKDYPYIEYKLQFNINGLVKYD